MGARPPRRLCRGADAIVTLLRDAAAAGVRRVLVDDGATLSRLRAAVPEIADAFAPWLEPSSLFPAYGVDEAIDRALAPVVALPSGGRLTIEETEALTAIDVDSGAETGVSARSTALSCDLEAAAAIGREVLLRDLAGVLVIDFVPLRRPAERARVLAALRTGLAGDDRQLRIGGWTRLGLVELGRERRGPSLTERLTGGCPACDGRGRVVSARWAAGDALRQVLAEARRAPAATPTLAAAPPVLHALRGPLAAATRGRRRQAGRQAAPDPIRRAAGRRLPPARADAGRGERRMSADNPTQPRTRSARPCPICGKPASARWRPFCSKRCADIDLGRWFGEAYRIPARGRGGPERLGARGRQRAGRRGLKRGVCGDLRSRWLPGHSAGIAAISLRFAGRRSSRPARFAAPGARPGSSVGRAAD